MTWRSYILLAGFGLAVSLFMAAFQRAPGYMDADAYYVVGRQLATGHGFTEPYLWNYLDNPAGIPHPSNAYWMPLISLIVAAGASLFGPNSWFAARIGIIAVATCLPPLTGALAWSFTSRKDFSLVSGLLAVFPAFYLPFISDTDTFGLYMLLGGLFFLVLPRSTAPLTTRSFLMKSLFLGVISGLMHLTRADGLLWLLLAFAAVLYVLPKPLKRNSFLIFYGILFTLVGYLSIMTPWFIRNYFSFGMPLAPGSAKALWLTSYDQLFTFPASQLTFQSWLRSGLSAIVKARLWALGLNLANALAVQAEVFLLPLIGLGLWQMREEKRVQLAVLAWLLTLGVMTIIFPFAGARGGFFHSGAALQMVWWCMAPLGLEKGIEWGAKKRSWNMSRARIFFRASLLGLAILLTLIIFWYRGVGASDRQPWDQENIAYSHIDDYLISNGATIKNVVMVANPPGFFLTSENPSLAIPDGDIETLLTVATKYHATYLVLEVGSVPVGLMPVYLNPTGIPGLIYLGETEEARIFLFSHQ